MADAIEKVLLEGNRLVVEAGTGTGKTLAYLVPAILSGMKIIVSTGTRNLQEQLFFNDIPLIRAALELPFQVSILKGRANYLCPHRLELSLGEHNHAGYRIDELIKIREWSSRTSTGDIAEITDVEENSAVWSYVTSTVDNCLGSTCSKIGECPVYLARIKANDADLVIVNHHLLFADLILKEEGIGQVLPSADGIILDEAHQLAETAGLFFGSTLSSRQLTELARDTLKEQLQLGNDDRRVVDAAQSLERNTRSLLLAFGKSSANRTWSDIHVDDSVRKAVSDVDKNLVALMDVLEETSVRSKGLLSCYRRSVRLADLFVMLTDEVVVEDEYIHWLETTDRSFVIHLSPLSIADQFSALINERDCSWVFTSATLAVGDSFAHFLNSLGLEHATQELKLDSPFDFERQALFYIPEALLNPSESDYTSVVVERALPVIKACRGRTFFLFTSYRALDQAAEQLAREPDLVCFVQGSLPKSELLFRFLHTERSVLLATSSFWEGVDVKGDLLTCVIIDKLPFMSPADPIVRARLDAMTNLGVNGFYQYMLPQAAISLKQGFGRLIRDEVDRGIFMLGDPRILTSSYGKVFLNNLPAMPLTRSFKEVESFLESIEQQ